MTDDPPQTAAAEWTGRREAPLGAIAEALGRVLVPGDVVLLSGPMGAGKTTFTRALARGLGLRRPDAVRSPTYNICVEHDGERPLAHVDLFRLAQGVSEAAPSVSSASVGAAAFEALGLSALLDEAESRFVVVVEWGELWQAPPPRRLEIAMTIAPVSRGADRRDLVATAHGSTMRRRLAQWCAAVR